LLFIYPSCCKLRLTISLTNYDAIIGYRETAYSCYVAIIN